MNTALEQSGGTGTGKLEEEKVVSVESLVADLLQWQRLQGHSDRTLQSCKQRLNSFWRFLEKRGLVGKNGVELEAITDSIIADYQTYLFEYPHSRTGGKLTSLSQTNYLNGVQVFFKFLCKTRRLARDPSLVIRLPRALVTLPSAVLSTQEVKLLLKMPDTRTVLGFRDRTIMEVLWSTGIRMKELLGLEVEDVRPEEGLLFIRDGKGGKQRCIPIGSRALSWLLRYIETVRPLLSREVLMKGCRWKKPAIASARLFLSRAGLACPDTSIGHRLRGYAKKARLKKRITVHVFRHTLATEMLKSGADLRHIQEMLGHERLTTTQRYLRVVKEELKRVHLATHPREQMPTGPVSYQGGDQ